MAVYAVQHKEHLQQEREANTDKKAKSKSTANQRIVKKLNSRERKFGAWCLKTQIWVEEIDNVLCVDKKLWPKLVHELQSKLDPPKDVTTLTTDHFFAGRFKLHRKKEKQKVTADAVSASMVLVPVTGSTGCIMWFVDTLTVLLITNNRCNKHKHMSLCVCFSTVCNEKFKWPRESRALIHITSTQHHSKL